MSVTYNRSHNWKLINRDSTSESPLHIHLHKLWNDTEEDHISCVNAFMKDLEEIRLFIYNLINEDILICFFFCFFF